MSSEDYKLAVRGQILASTNEDLHGERYDKQFLEKLLMSAPEEIPLHTKHDDTVGHFGVVKNPSIEKIDEDTWGLIGDVFSKDGEIPNDIGGFSWSALYAPTGPEDSEIIVYLPFPLYRDEEFNKELLSHDQVAVGQFIVKGEGPFLTALVDFFELVAAGTLSQILAKQVHSKLSKHWEVLEDLWEREIGTKFRIPIEFEGYEFPLIMVPDHEDYEKSLSEEELERLGALVEYRLKKHDFSNVRQIHKIRATYDPEEKKYDLVDIQVITSQDNIHVVD